MSEQEFLEREQKLERAYREGMIITLEEKRIALANLRAEWESQPIDYGDCPPETWNANWPPFQG